MPSNRRLEEFDSALLNPSKGPEASSFSLLGAAFGTDRDVLDVGGPRFTSRALCFQSGGFSRLVKFSLVGLTNL